MLSTIVPLSVREMSNKTLKREFTKIFNTIFNDGHYGTCNMTWLNILEKELNYRNITATMAKTIKFIDKNKKEVEEWEITIHLTVDRNISSMQQFIHRRLYSAPTYDIKVKNYKQI